MTKNDGDDEGEPFSFVVCYLVKLCTRFPMATIAMALTKINLLRLPPSPSSSSRSSFNPTRCSSIQQLQVDSTISCEPCNGRGWIVCDFCQGQKTNVMAENNRIYRRCPSCRAVGYVLCSKCKVFKCVTFPNYSDGADLSF